MPSPVVALHVVCHRRALRMFCRGCDMYPWLEAVLLHATTVDCVRRHCRVPPDFDWAATDYDPSLRTCPDGHAAVCEDVLELLAADTTQWGAPDHADHAVVVVVSRRMLADIRETH